MSVNKTRTVTIILQSTVTGNILNATTEVEDHIHVDTVAPLHQ